MTTLEFLLTKYGVLLDTVQLAETLKLSRGTVSNRLSKKTIPLPIVTIAGSTRPLFRAADVAELVDGTAGKSKSNAEKALAGV